MATTGLLGPETGYADPDRLTETIAFLVTLLGHPSSQVVLRVSEALASLTQDFEASGLFVETTYFQDQTKQFCTVCQCKLLFVVVIGTNRYS
jgi:hypothetical protein